MSYISKKNNYFKDSVFDNFDLKEYFSKNIYIKPCNEENFIYYSELQQMDMKISQKLSTQNSKKKKEVCQLSRVSEVISQIDDNDFGIKIEDIKIRTDNGTYNNLLNYYTPLKYIGHGSFGLVFSVVKIDTAEIFAIKIIKKSPKNSQAQETLNEAKILQKLHNPRILKLHKVIETVDYLLLFMDLIEGGTLSDFILDRYIKSKSGELDYFITDAESSTIMKGILEGINYIHKKGIMHRDLKPDNIMFKNKNDLNSIIICDFGISGRYYNNCFTNEKCGTLIYMAPETINDRPSDHLVDVWACGIILYILESGGEHPLFINGMSREDFIKLVLTKKKTWKFNENFPDLARNFFMKLCKTEPLYRYQTNKALQHPWITRQEKDNVIPLGIVETFTREHKIKEFKAMISCMIFMKNFKNNNKKLFEDNNNNNCNDNNNNKCMDDNRNNNNKINQMKFDLFKTPQKNSRIVNSINSNFINIINNTNNAIYNYMNSNFKDIKKCNSSKFLRQRSNSLKRKNSECNLKLSSMNSNINFKIDQNIFYNNNHHKQKFSKNLSMTKHTNHSKKLIDCINENNSNKNLIKNNNSNNNNNNNNLLIMPLINNNNHISSNKSSKILLLQSSKKINSSSSNVNILIKKNSNEYLSKLKDVLETRFSRAHDSTNASSSISSSNNLLNSISSINKPTNDKFYISKNSKLIFNKDNYKYQNNKIKFTSSIKTTEFIM